MNEIQSFDNGEFKIEIIAAGDSFTVGAPGLARALGSRDAANMLRSIPEEEKGYSLVSTPGGDQGIWHVTEPGFYRAIGQRQASRIKNEKVRDQVVRFQNWVFREVLPAIRRHGHYAPQDTRPEIADGPLERAAVAREQVLAYKAAEGLLDRTWLAGKAKVALARMAGEEPEIAEEDRPLYVPDFLKSKGLKRDQITGAQSVFGRRAAALHEAEHGVKPGKRSSETTNGSIRNTLAWTQRHLPLFEEVWDRWYADQYPTAPHLFAVDGGGAR